MYGDSVKKELNDLIETYGYFDTFPNGELAGRASLLIENMAVFPKPGKKEAFKAATEKLNLYLKETKKKINGEEKECFTFESRNLPEFEEVVREVVKSRNK